MTNRRRPPIFPGRMSYFEIIMLLCFGVSWPVSIHRSWTSRSTGGKSPLFMALIITGYIAGVINKFMNNLDIVVVLYAINQLNKLTIH